MSKGTRYLGGFLGEGQEEWIEKKIDDCIYAVKKFAKIIKYVPQSVFVGLQRSLKHEWVYLQRVTDLGGNTGGFRSLEEALSDSLLPGIFGCQPPDRRITKLPFKVCGLSIPNPSERAEYNFKASRESADKIITSILENSKLNIPNHTAKTRQMREHNKKITCNGRNVNWKVFCQHKVSR